MAGLTHLKEAGSQDRLIGLNLDRMDGLDGGLILQVCGMSWMYAWRPDISYWIVQMKGRQGYWLIEKYKSCRLNWLHCRWLIESSWVYINQLDGFLWLIGLNGCRLCSHIKPGIWNIKPGHCKAAVWAYWLFGHNCDKGFPSKPSSQTDFLLREMWMLNRIKLDAMACMDGKLLPFLLEWSNFANLVEDSNRALSVILKFLRHTTF